MRLHLRVLLGVLCAGAIAGAQERPDDENETATLEDRWTKGDAEAIARLGYVRIGPMSWGDNHDTPRIEEVLGDKRFRWVETAHFKIGSAMPTCRLPRDKDQKKKLIAELKRLEPKLDDLDADRIRTLDPWLRTHLLAQRLEALYAEIEQLLGVTDADFPAADAPFFRNQVPGYQKWMGRGPILGVKGKFLVLVCTKESNCARYLKAFTASGVGEQPSRWYFPNTDAFVFATAIDFHEGIYRDDARLHAHLAFNLTHNLLDAYKGYSYNSPVWWQEGLAHRVRRELWKEHNEFTAIDEDTQRAYTRFDWLKIGKQRVGFDLVRPWDQMLDLKTCADFSLVDHIACWSRVEFLLATRGDAAFALFVDQVKGFVDSDGKAPTDEALSARQREAMQEAFGADAAALDAEWRVWIKKQKGD